VVDLIHSLECQMSKREPARAAKHARSPKIAAKAQRAAQAIVRSPRDSRVRSAGQARLNRPQSVLTTHNKRLFSLSIR
jgi:hypothetical protein